jgi:hypothetical protein
MEKQEAQEILVNAMGSLFAEAEIEAGIAEAAGISREDYNKIIENGLELPDYIKKYRESNRKRKLYEEKLLKAELNDQLLENAELKPDDIPPPVIKSMIEAKILEAVKDRDGKYPLNKGKTDRKAITWIFNDSGYDDEITSQIYYDFVSTKCKQSTIERYFSDAKNASK